MDDILQYAIDNGIIDLSYVQQQIEMNKRKELLSKHPYEIWKASDGKWKTYLPDDEKGRVQRKRNTQKEIEDMIVDFWKEKLDNPTLEEVFNEWNDRRLELKKISAATHLRNRQIFKRHYNDCKCERIRDLTILDYEEFLEEQIAVHDLTSKAFCNLKSVTRGLLKRAKKRGLIDFNVEQIFQELDTSDSEFQVKIKEDYEEVFNDEEMDKITKYLMENRDLRNLAILLMFYTGMRIGELVALKKQDLGKNFIKIRRTETRYINEEGKFVFEVKEFPKSQAGVRTIIVPRDFCWILERLKWLNPGGEYIFAENGCRLKTHNIRRRLDRVCKNTGVYHKSPHKIRKTYASILLDNKVDDHLVTEMMGHVDISCSEEHYHRNRKSMERKSNIISALPEFKAK